MNTSSHLTNRVLFQRAKKALCVFLCLLCMFPPSKPEDTPVLSYAEEITWPAAPSVKAEGAILMEAATGTVLFEKNAKGTFLTASTTKIVTALIAMEESAPGEIVTVSHDAVYGIPTDSSRIWVDEGEQLTMEDSLYALMLPSANDMAYAIAEHISGTIPAFAEKMNSLAKRLGWVNSHFVNPHGYDEENHYSCPFDLALTMRELLKYPNFLTISGSKNHKIPATNLCKEDRWILNTHLMIRGTNPYEGVIAGKTGHTDLAGSNLVTVARRGNLSLIAVLMKAPDDTSLYQDTAALFDYGFSSFQMYNMNREVSTENLTIPPLFSKEDIQSTISGSRLFTVEAGSVILPLQASLNDVQREISLNKLTAFQKGRNPVGEVSYTYGGRKVGFAKLIYENTGEAFSTQNESPGTTSATEVTVSPIKEEASETKPANEKESNPVSDKRPLIIGITLGLITFFVGIYLIFVEIPYRQRRRRRNR